MLIVALYGVGHITFFGFLRKSTKTSMKRKLRWSEDNPDFAAYEPDQAFPSGPGDVVAKVKAEEQQPQSKRLKGEDGGGVSKNRF